MNVTVILGSIECLSTFDTREGSFSAASGDRLENGESDVEVLEPADPEGKFRFEPAALAWRVLVYPSNDETIDEFFRLGKRSRGSSAQIVAATIW
jgi:hypothetical protein